MHTTRKVGALCAVVAGFMAACSDSARTEAGGLYTAPDPNGTVQNTNPASADPNTSPPTPEATGGGDQTGTSAGGGTSGTASDGSGSNATGPGNAERCDAGACGASAADDGDEAFAGASTCSSGVTWLFGNQATDVMRPGLACNECHRTMFEEIYTVAGTVYPTGHEPDDCFGASGLNSDLKVEVTDSNGKVLTLVPNLSGNFHTKEALAFPITTRVLAGGKERPMIGEVDAAGGDCNTCHTENGIQDAPGRIATP